MRYWINSEDEDYEREKERVSKYGGVVPAPLSAAQFCSIAILVAIHTVALAGAVFVLAFWS